MAATGPSRQSLRAAHCHFSTDRVPHDAATTAWKRTARLRQARFREARGLPIGTQPYAGGENATPVGSRIPLDVAQATGANFISAEVHAAVRARLAAPEPYETLNAARLWCDLLSSMPLCFNLFGALVADANAATRAAQRWWPDAPPGRATLRFEHSPGRRDPAFLGNQSAFDAAIELESPRGDRAIIGIETKYHEHAKAERAPKPSALARYEAVTERAGIFRPHWRDAIVGTPLQQLWLDHLLVLSMLQHPSARWTWGRFVLVTPSANPSFTHAAAKYRALLKEPQTFEARTIESLLAAHDALPRGVATAFAERYL